MPISTWRQKNIERLMAEYGTFCHYCPTPVHLRIATYTRRPDDATIDHRIPKANGGSNSYENFLLACRRCNEAKGDQDYYVFKADPRPVHVKEREQRRREKAKQDDDKSDLQARVASQLQKAKAAARIRLGVGTMASAIAGGSMHENGEWKKPPTPTWMDWPWLCELMAPLIRDVGSLGPWGNVKNARIR